MARPDELVMLRAVSKLKDYVVFAWTSKGDLWHIMSPMALVPPWGEYYPRLCTREQFEKLALVDVLLEQTQGGRALASNSYSYGGHFVHSLRLGTGAPISFTAGVSPESEFVRLEFYCRDESQPFLTADNIKVDMRWYQDTNAVARVVTRPKDEYKLILETKVADPDDPSDPDTPGHDCPGYVVVEGARGIYHGPMRYYPKDGWVRLRPVANPGYRFVKWETSENVTGAVLFFGTPFIEIGINAVAEERIAVRMDDDTTITAVFKWDPIKVVQLAQGDLPEREIREEDDPATPDIREDVATISAAPAMPELRVSLNGGRSDVMVRWRMEILYRWRRLDATGTHTLETRRYYPRTTAIQSGQQFDQQDPQFDQSNQELQNPEFRELPGNLSWVVNWGAAGRQFFGGEVTVYAEFCNQPQDEEPITFEFKILGTNPSIASVRGRDPNLTVQDADFLRALLWQESLFRQFMWPLSGYVDGSLGYPLPNGFFDRPAAPDEFYLRTDGGLGMGQITWAPTLQQVWNWPANFDEAAVRLNDCYSRAVAYLDDLLDGTDVTATAENYYKEAWHRYQSGPRSEWYDGVEDGVLVEHNREPGHVVGHVNGCWDNYVTRPWE